jgi:hypothetical protein
VSKWALTNWRGQMEGQGRMGKGTEWATGTHTLEAAYRGTSQSGKETEWVMALTN